MGAARNSKSGTRASGGGQLIDTKRASISMDQADIHPISPASGNDTKKSNYNGLLKTHVGNMNDNGMFGNLKDNLFYSAVKT